MVYVFTVDPDTSQKKKQYKRSIYATFHMTCPMFEWSIWTHWQFSLAKVKQRTHAKSLRIKKFGAVVFRELSECKETRKNSKYMLIAVVSY